jgi:hypothetical protein
MDDVTGYLTFLVAGIVAAIVLGAVGWWAYGKAIRSLRTFIRSLWPH